jgi:ketosteroid isomerase-like protein
MKSTEEAALAFLQAYWRGDLAAALSYCTGTAKLELPQSGPLETPALMVDVLPVIFEQIYPRFVGGRFDIQMENIVSERSLSVVEYIAVGRLNNGHDYRCRYAMVLTVKDGKVAFARQYADTHYVVSELLAGATTGATAAF